MSLASRGSVACAEREPASARLENSVEKRRAIFLDRDGVLNRNVLYPDTRAYESPRSPSEFVLTGGVCEALQRLRAAGFLLILISNQPNAVNGKCTRAMLDQIHARLVALLRAEGVALTACYYCYHHPDHTGPCLCRKPSPYFLEQAIAEFQLDRGECWMIGDRATDLACGAAAGLRTVWIDNSERITLAADDAPEVTATSLADAVLPLLSAAATRQMTRPA